MVRCLMLIYGRLGHLRPPECSDANTEKGAARYGNPFRWRGFTISSQNTKNWITARDEARRPLNTSS
jgi:hypothetical protein